LIKGKKIAAVFGFCDIRNFTDATEELQEGVMVFVNELARIVHSTIDHYSGAANKNIGDAFLLVWKFDSEEIQELSDPVIFKPESKQVKYMGDLALVSFLKIMVKVNKDPVVLKYRSNAKLVKRMPGYQVKFGFGLHLGWAIEGAIGSNFKIDASYLSHHVNMASNLEGLTKNYGIPILLTDRVQNILSPLGQKYCRHVDTISLKGGRDVYQLYTSDVDFSGVMPGKFKDNSKERTKNKRRALKFRLEQGVLESSEVLEESKEIALIKKSFTEEFFEAHAQAMKMYLDGKWNDAHSLFKNVLKIRDADGPSKSIIAYMEENNFQAPQDWKGIRPLY
jgi:class 3 adenylate cyclase